MTSNIIPLHERTWKTPHGILQHTPVDRLEWLELREHCVTASVAGALLGVHEYVTAYELWAQKSGLVPPINADDPVLVRGELLEDDAIELLGRKHPGWQITPNIIGKGGVFLEEPSHRMGATPDAFVLDDERVPAIVEIKTTDYSTFRNKWGGPDNPQPPLWIAVQATVTAYLAGARKAYVACLVVGRTLDLHVMPIETNLAVIKKIQKASTDFWIAVDQNTPPNPDYERDGAVIAALLPHDQGTTIDLTGDPEFVAACVERMALHEQIAGMTAKMGRHDALIRHRIGTHSYAVAGDFRVSNKLVQRKGFVVKPTEYRKLTIKLADGEGE
jgi:predicted phage-related endonuclease